MDRNKLSEILSEMATFMDLLGENPFKIRAFQNGARIIDTFDGDLETALTSGQLAETKGIGPGLLEKIKEFAKSGTVSEHEKLKSKIPEGLIEMLQVQGLGPKKVKALHEQLGITTLGELEYACKENRLLGLDGFGEKSQSKILSGIEFLKKFKGVFLFRDAYLEAQLIRNLLSKLKSVANIEIAGSIRRRKEVIKDIDILVASSKPLEVMNKFVKLPNVDKVTNSGDTKSSVILKNGMACDLRVVSAAEYPYALMYFTGSKEHNTELRSIAKTKGLKLNEYGLFKGEKNIPCKTEAEIYDKLGLTYIEPEMRELSSVIPLSQKNALPDLVVLEQIKGVFHCHTTDSDGINSLEEMVGAAQALGFEYIGISDHSQSSFYANGLKEARVLSQFKQIEALQKKFKIKIFKGIEADILSNGDLDYPKTLLKKFDFVIGSIHSGFVQDEEKMTKRVLAAFENPYLDFLGHPTGRLLLAREGYPLNMQRVIEAAHKNNVIIEVNANTQRLDLDWRWGSSVVKNKVMVSINPDAHSVAGLEDVEFGVGIARKAGFGPKSVINTLPASQVLKSLKRNQI